MCVRMCMTFPKILDVTVCVCECVREKYLHRKRTIKQESNHLYGVKVEFYINPNQKRKTEQWQM